MYFNQKIKIQNKIIYKGRCFVVAEISANHSGSLSKLKRLILRLKKINVDAIKIQAYEANTITINSDSPDFKIPKGNAWEKFKNLYQLYQKAETPFHWYKEIFDFCKANKVIVFASVFDVSSLNLLEKIGCPAYKIASPEITDIPLISAVAKTKKPIIISNGLGSIKDLSLAIRSVKKERNKNLIILKCTSSYPAPLNEINLEMMEFIKKKYKVLSGYSDHTLKYHTAIHSASLGAVLLERHVSFKDKKSVDDFFSSSIEEFGEMIKIIRSNELANGKIIKGISNSSKINLNGRRSLYVVNDIKKGEKFSNKNIRSIRPSYGLHPKFLDQFLNKKSARDIKFGERLKWIHVKK
jgi:N-acetylneuraminate synthase/pseudaminic acid synthase